MEEESKFESGYQQGSRAAWLQLLQMCLRDLGYDGTEAEHTAWISEREQAVTALRSVCAEGGSNDWPDDLHLADVISKYLPEYNEG